MINPKALNGTNSLGSLFAISFEVAAVLEVEFCRRRLRGGGVDISESTVDAGAILDDFIFKVRRRRSRYLVLTFKKMDQPGRWLNLEVGQTWHAFTSREGCVTMMSA